GPGGEALVDGGRDLCAGGVDRLPDDCCVDVLKGVVRLQEEVAEDVGRGDRLAIGLDVDGDELASTDLELSAHRALLPAGSARASGPVHPSSPAERGHRSSGPRQSDATRVPFLTPGVEATTVSAWQASGSS